MCEPSPGGADPSSAALGAIGFCIPGTTALLWFLFCKVSAIYCEKNSQVRTYLLRMLVNPTLRQSYFRGFLVFPPVRRIRHNHLGRFDQALQGLSAYPNRLFDKLADGEAGSPRHGRALPAFFDRLQGLFSCGRSRKRRREACQSHALQIPFWEFVLHSLLSISRCSRRSHTFDMASCLLRKLFFLSPSSTGRIRLFGECTNTRSIHLP